MEMNLNGGEIDVCRKCISNKIESLGIYNFPVIVSPKGFSLCLFQFCKADSLLVLA